MAAHRRPFKRRFFGYQTTVVDAYVADAERARSAWSDELARLQKVEPLTRMGDDIADLLTSFATAVLTLRDQLTEEAGRIRSEAEEYAARRMADADRMLEMARQQAREVAREMISHARAEIALLADQQMTIADALDRAAQGIAVSKEAIAKIQGPRGISAAPGDLELHSIAAPPGNGLGFDGPEDPGTRDAPETSSATART